MQASARPHWTISRRGRPSSLFTGPDTGAARLPAGMLTREHARLRLRVNDGLHEGRRPRRASPSPAGAAGDDACEPAAARTIRRGLQSST